MTGKGKTTDCRTLTEAYSRQGIEVRNPRRTWSAVDPKTGKVVVTLWTDRFQDVDRRSYSTFGLDGKGWSDRYENRLRVEHLKLALSKNKGLFESIIVTANDALHSRIVRCEIGPRMRVVEVDESTGRFRAERA
jgi:IS1 family transposase